MAENAILYDSSKCSACKGCQVQCKQWNMLPASLGKDVYGFTGSYQAPMDLSGSTRLIIQFDESEGDNGVEWAFGRKSCYHCSEPACMEVCSANAISKLDNGTVFLDSTKCVGCKYCTNACPFEVPKYREAFNYSDKCTLCNDRVTQGRKPACVQTCPAGALSFGERDEMLTKGKERIEYLKNKGFDKAELYGETEMGGLHVISVAKYGLEAHGYIRDPKTSPMVAFTQLMKPITGVTMGAVVVGLGISFLSGLGYKRDKASSGSETTHEDTEGKEI